MWRRPGERYSSPHTVVRHTARTMDVMVCGESIAHDSRSTLVVVGGTLTGQRYVDDIFRPHLGYFLNGLPGAIFSKILLIRAQLELPRLPTPCSDSAMDCPLPDSSSREHVCDQLKRQMSLCHSARDLVVAVQDLWARLSQGNIRRLINSMPDHVAACIAAGGGSTRY